MRKSQKLIVVLLLGVLCPMLFGQASFISTYPEKRLIQQEIELFVDTADSFSIENIHTATFSPYAVWQHQIKGNQTYWGKFQVHQELRTTAMNQEWILEFPIVLTDVEVYVKAVDGKITKSKTGMFVPLQERTFVPIVKSNLVYANLFNEATTTVFFKAKCERKKAVPNFKIYLTNSIHFFQELKNKKLSQGIFIGFMLMMLMYNLFLFFYTAKDLAYINYSFYILGIVLYSAYNSGELFDLTTWLFFSENPKFSYLGKTSTYLIIFGYLHFLKTFFHLDKLLPRWNVIFKLLLWLNLLAFVTDVALMIYTNFNSDISDIITVGNASLFVLFILIFCFDVFRTSSRKGYFIIAGILLMGIGAIFTIVSRIKGIDYSTLPFQIGTILEIMIFSLGLVYRRNEIEQEKKAAFLDLEKSKILRIQEQNEAQRLKELNQLKSQLYTNVTHEFRTPLTIIKGATEAIIGHENEINIINRNSNQLLRLINQMLDLSRMEAKLLEVHYVQSDIVAFLRYITESFHSMAKSKNIRLTFYSEDKAIMMDFDKEKMEHVIYNLISNAVKFTNSGGKIILHVKKLEEQSNPFLQIKIKDTGQGIPEEDLPYIFDRFYQRDQQLGGTGIGLSFVKEIIELLNGTIAAKSELDIGSEFVVLLPIVNTFEPVDLSLAHAHNKDVQLNEASLDAERSNKNLPVLLLIEDNRDVSKYIQNILKKDYRLHCAFDGKKGVETALEIIPDIIISDVMMPQMNGYEVTRTLKEDQRTSHIPIIMLTAKATQPDKNEGLASGADVFLMKPFDKEELLIRLSNIQEQRKVLIEKFQMGFFKPIQTVSAIAPTEEVFIKKVENYLIKNIGDPDIGIEAIATQLNMSKNQFYRKVKALTGHPPTKLISDIRLNKALELLESSKLNISEVAYQVGFGDPNYFSRVFHKKFGKSPKHFSK